MLLRAQRHADADFVCALRDGVGHHTVDSDRRQHQGENRKESQQQHVEPPRRHLLGQQLVHGRDVEDGRASVDAVYLRPQRAHQGQRVPCGADNHRHLGIRHLQIGHKDLRFGSRSQPGLPQIAHYADDRRPVHTSDLNALADRALIRKETSHTRLVEDDDLRSFGRVLRRERPPRNQGSADGVKIARANDVNRGCGADLGARGAAFDLESGRHHIALEREHHHRLGRGYARQSAEAGQQSLKEGALQVGFLISSVRETHAHG